MPKKLGLIDDWGGKESCIGSPTCRLNSAPKPVMRQTAHPPLANYNSTEVSAFDARTLQGPPAYSNRRAFCFNATSL